MSRFALTAARVGLICFGVALAGSGVTMLAFPHAFFSDSVDIPHLSVRLLIAIGVIGYGTILLASPRWLARSRLRQLALAIFVATFASGLVLRAPEQFSALQIAAVVMQRIWPAALAIILAEVEPPGSATR